MGDGAREAWITGIGMISCLGEGPEAHWQGLAAAKPTADTQTFAPNVVHPLAPIEFEKQIPKKGDLRQMEPWQRIGVYAAGLALEHAGVKGQTDILSRMDMVVAAGGGERDLAVDSSVLSGIRHAKDRGAYLNERLMNDLRPTLFLAQLSNLLAGNVSIVHGVTGSSRTFMGEEAAGIDAVRTSLMRVLAGQSDMILVGGSCNAERQDQLILYEFGGYNLESDFRPVWERAPIGGIAHASLGAFIIIEERRHALARGAKGLARLSMALSDRTRRRPGAITASLERLWTKIAPQIAADRCAIISGASGAEPATGEERAFLRAHAELPVRATATRLGHGFEPQFSMNVGLAALAVSRRALFPTGDRSGMEKDMAGELRQVAVTGVGHWRGEGLAFIEALD